jgi:hypothetical protein
VTAPYSSSNYPRHMRDRSYWLPPRGIGNGLDAQTWAVLVDADASQLILLLDELREAGIAAYAARVDRLGRRAAASTFRIWVDTWTHARAEDVVRKVLTQRVKVPSPALVLAGAAVAAQIVPDLRAPPQLVVERVVTVALACILFEGGMHIGWSRFRSAAAPIAASGVLGTFLMVVAAALLVHLAVGTSWYTAVLIAAAVAPTDPAMVFSVLGQREIAGRPSPMFGALVRFTIGPWRRGCPRTWCPGRLWP